MKEWTMLVVENVSHGFGARTILENVSFRLKKGEHIALVGANGNKPACKNKQQHHGNTRNNFGIHHGDVCNSHNT